MGFDFLGWLIVLRLGLDLGMQLGFDVLTGDLVAGWRRLRWMVLVCFLVLCYCLPWASM